MENSTNFSFFLTLPLFPAFQWVEIAQRYSVSLFPNSRCMTFVKLEYEKAKQLNMIKLKLSINALPPSLHYVLQYD